MTKTARDAAEGQMAYLVCVLDNGGFWSILDDGIIYNSMAAAAEIAAEAADDPTVAATRIIEVCLDREYPREGAR